MTFAYHRSVEPMLWALVVLSFIELCVIHLLVALPWSVPAAIMLSAASLAGVAWLLLIRSFRRLPVLIGDEGLSWRVGFLRCVVMPLRRVAGPRADLDGAAVKRRDMFNAVLLAFPMSCSTSSIRSRAGGVR